MKEEKTREVEEEKIILWANLSEDILGLIIARLSAPEVLMFRNVCKSWRQWFETSSYQSYLSTTLTSMRLSDDVTRFPVLMTVHRKFCSFFHPMYNTTIRKVIPELVDARLFHTKGEWALVAKKMEHGDDDSIVIFFFNVDTTVKIDVPSLPVTPSGFTFVFKKMCFFSNPDSTDWSIIGMTDTFVGTIKHGQPSWTVSYLPKFGIWTNPIAVFNREEELCYSLGKNGTLFSFDHTKLISGGDTKLHKVSNKPPLPLQYNRHRVQIDERFLVHVKGEEEDGVLLAIFKYKINTYNRVSKKNEDISLISPVYEETYTTSVYEFNFANSEWRELDNLGNRMLFVARTGSMLFQVGEEASNKVMAKNKVYYPNVWTDNSIFYSLATESDHCFLLNPSTPHCRDPESVVISKNIDNNYLPSYSPSSCGWIDPMSQSFFL